MFRPVRLHVHKVCHDQQGGVAITFAITAGLLLAIGGGVLDYGRATAVSAALQKAADIAAIAAISAPNGTQAERMAAAQQMFKSNYRYKAEYPVTPAITVAGRKATVSAEAAVPLYFLGVIGISSYNVATG